MGKLVALTSPETAAMVLAFHLREKHVRTPAAYQQIVDRVRDFNAENQQSTEDRALQVDQQLEAERLKVQRQVANGEMAGGGLPKPISEMSDAELKKLAQGDIAAGATGLALEADILMRQRENIGTALGSLQAAAAMYHSLDTALHADPNDPAAGQIVLNFGDNKAAAQDRFDALRLSPKTGALRYDVASGWQIVTSYGGLRRFLSEQELNTAEHDQWEKIKSDTSPTDGYDVPFWRKEWTDAEGNKRDYAWRTEQRNDIEWLRRAGGGLITRITGAGKTNTALGFFAHKIAENSSYKGVVVVPKGKVAEWGSEARKFSTLPVVEIPEGARRDQVARILAQADPGSVVLMAHKDAAANHDTLTAYAPDGMVIDEPQELTTQKAANLSTGAKKVMQIPAQNRIALTATPARKNPVEAYNLINWTNPKALGARTRFAGAYSGFGAGTNSADASIISQLSTELAPYISGEAVTPPSFQTHAHDHVIKRTSEQVEAHRELTRRSQGFLQVAIDNVPQDQRVGNWRKRAKDQALKQLGEDRKAILSGVTAKHTGITAAKNAKVEQVIDQFKRAPDVKHVVYVDSDTQRQALKARLLEEGLKPDQIKNMAQGTGADIAKRKRAFVEDPDARVVFIDKASAAGHNLQVADHIHIVGNPADAANYLQALGRVKRDPRSSDVHVHSYRYDDDPHDDVHWDALNAQLKLMRATSPGLVGKSKRLVLPGSTLLRKAKIPASPDWGSRVERVHNDRVSRRATISNMTPDQYRGALDQHVSNLVSKAHVHVQVHGTSLDGILADGRFKTQHETGMSTGHQDVDRRKEYERRLFGIPHDAAPAKRPIYGFLSHDVAHERAAGNIQDYGEISLRLHPRVRSRTTFTAGDSFGATQGGDHPAFAPQPVNKPSHRALNLQFGAGRNPLRHHNMAQLGGDDGYTEAQIHGGVNSSDIAEIIAPHERHISPAVRQWATSNKVPITIRSFEDYSGE